MFILLLVVGAVTRIAADESPVSSQATLHLRGVVYAGTQISIAPLALDTSLPGMPVSRASIDAVSSIDASIAVTMIDGTGTMTVSRGGDQERGELFADSFHVLRGSGNAAHLEIAYAGADWATVMLDISAP